jgi:hypothetical protein
MAELSICLPRSSAFHHPGVSFFVNLSLIQPVVESIWRSIFEWIPKMRSTLLVIIAAAVTNAQSECYLDLTSSPIPAVIPASCTALHLSTNQIGDAAVALAEALKYNTALTALHLSTNQIGDAGATALAEALKINAVLTTLDLDSNQIGVAGATALAEALKINTALTTVYLTYNQIGDAGATALAEALKINTALTTLYLTYNQIGDAGATALANMLFDNMILTKLDLSNNGNSTAGNYISSCAAVAFNDVLVFQGSQEGQGLRYLYLTTNRIGDVAVAKLIQGSESWHDDLKVSVGNNPIERCDTKGKVTCDGGGSGLKMCNELSTQPMIDAGDVCDIEWDANQCSFGCDVVDCGNGNCTSHSLHPCTCNAGWNGTDCKNNIGTPCGEGEYISNKTTVGECQPCPANTYQNEDNHTYSECKFQPTCKPGTMIDLAYPELLYEKQRWSCVPCPDGTYTPETNAAHCLYRGKCKSGKVYISNKITGGECKPCPANTYQNETDHLETECKPQTECAAGFFMGNITKTKLATCTACPENTYQNEDNHTLTECKPQPTCDQSILIGDTLSSEGRCHEITTTATTENINKSISESKTWKWVVSGVGLAIVVLIASLALFF